MLLHGKPLSRGGMNEGKICKLWNEKKVLKSRKIGFHNWARINDFGLGKDKVNIVHIVLRTSALLTRIKKYPKCRDLKLDHSGVETHLSAAAHFEKSVMPLRTYYYTVFCRNE